MKNVEARVAVIVSEQLGQSVEDISAADKLADLGADSLDRVELILALEDEFEIVITDEEGEKLLTVQQIIDCVRASRAVEGYR